MSFYSHLTFIYDKNVSSKKVIVCRRNDMEHNNIYLIDNSPNNYYLGYSSDWLDNFAWFNVN